MHGADAASAAMQAAVDVHQAAVIAGRDDRGVRAEDGVKFFIEHRAGDVGVLNRKGAAETAALFQSRQRDKIDVVDCMKKGRRAIAELE